MCSRQTKDASGKHKTFHYLLCISNTATTMTSMIAPPTTAPKTIIELFCAWYSAVRDKQTKFSRAT